MLLVAFSAVALDSALAVPLVARLRRQAEPFSVRSLSVWRGALLRMGKEASSVTPCAVLNDADCGPVVAQPLCRQDS